MANGAMQIKYLRECAEIFWITGSTEGERCVRSGRTRNESAYTIKKFGVVNRYDLRKEFPALTLRRTALKSAFDELLWIWQKKSNNVHDLNSTSGTHGQMRTARSERLTAISSWREASVQKKARWIRWTV